MTHSQMEGCPLRLVAKFDGDHWKVHSPVGEHNHDLLPTEAFSRYRKEAIQDRKAEIISKWNNNTRPYQILLNFQTDPDPLIRMTTRHDLYNMLSGHRNTKTTTSIVESLHSGIKRLLWASTGDLMTVFQKLGLFWQL